MNLLRPLAVSSFFFLGACAPVSERSAQVADPAINNVEETGNVVLVPGYGQGRDGAEAHKRAVEDALAEAARIRSVHIETVTSSTTKESREVFVGGGVKQEQRSLSDVFQDWSRSSAQGQFSGTQVQGAKQTGKTSDGLATCRLRVAVPSLQVYPARFLFRAAQETAAVQALAAVALRFEEAGLPIWALEAWLRSARHPKANSADRLSAAEGCERLMQRVEAWRLVNAEVTALSNLPENNPDRQRAQTLLTRLSVAPSSAEIWRQLEGCADTGRAQDRFQVSQAAVTNTGITLHWQIGGPARRVFTLWSDGEDLGWLNLKGGERSFTGIAKTDLALGAGKSGTILAWSLIDSDSVFDLAAALPRSGIPLGTNATPEARLQLDALRVALERAVAGGAASLRLRVSRP